MRNGGEVGGNSRQVIPFTKVEAVCLFIKRIESSKNVSVGNLTLKFCLLACLFLVVGLVWFFFSPPQNSLILIYVYICTSFMHLLLMMLSFGPISLYLSLFKINTSLTTVICSSDHPSKHFFTCSGWFHFI